MTAAANQLQFINSPPANHYTIPVYPHVRKFIRQTYATHFDKKTFHLTEHVTPGKLVTMALREKRSRNHLCAIGTGRPESAQKITDEITIALTTHQMNLSPRLSKLYRLNIDFDNLFKEHMITFLVAQYSMGTPVFHACKNFLEQYEIKETQFSVDTAYKYWQRWNSKSLH